jgi:hypothetical protein
VLISSRVRCKRIAERAEPGIEGAPGAPQRLLRLQHHRKLREVETADMDQRACAFLARHADGVREGIADFAQCHEPERRRQVERGLRGRAGAWFHFRRFWAREDQWQSL